jgi:hypothetical protein
MLVMNFFQVLLNRIMVSGLFPHMHAKGAVQLDFSQIRGLKRLKIPPNY